jgi:hydroxyacylglutathione hydrolase
VLQNDAIQKLDDFSQKNKETQGKFTIGDEKKHNVFMRVDVSDARVSSDAAEVADGVTGSRDPSACWA